MRESPSDQERGERDYPSYMVGRGRRSYHPLTAKVENCALILVKEKKASCLGGERQVPFYSMGEGRLLVGKEKGNPDLLSYDHRKGLRESVLTGPQREFGLASRGLGKKGKKSLASPTSGRRRECFISSQDKGKVNTSDTGISKGRRGGLSFPPKERKGKELSPKSLTSDMKGIRPVNKGESLLLHIKVSD